MRRNALVLGVWLAGVTVALGQFPPNVGPPATIPPARDMQPARQLPPEIARAITPPAGTRQAGVPPQLGTTPPSTTTPTPATAPTAEVPPEPTGPQPFDAPGLRVKREGNSWQLWAGTLLLKDFGPSQLDALEALQLFRELHVNARGSIGGVFEYWLTDGQAPSAPTRYRRVVPFDSAALRVEKLNSQWVLRDPHAVLYQFGSSETDARQALAVCQRYGFNQLGIIGQPTPTFKYLVRDQAPSMSSRGLRDQVTSMAVSPMTAPKASAVPVAERRTGSLALPNEGTVGQRIPFDARQLELRRTANDWTLYAGPALLGRCGGSERDARAVVEALKDFRVTELCRIGDSDFGFFLSGGRAPQGSSIVGLSAKPLKVDRLSVRQVDGKWAVFEDNRPLWDFGPKGEEARHALTAIQQYGFDQVIPIGAGRTLNMQLLVKTH
jgi:hypothetical protein